MTIENDIDSLRAFMADSRSTYVRMADAAAIDRFLRDPPLGRNRCALWIALPKHRTLLKQAPGVTLRVVPWTINQRAVLTLSRVRLTARVGATP